jgi:hypothetical protein
MEASGQLHAPVTLSPGRVPGAHWVDGRVGPGTGLDTGEEVYL